MNWNLQPDLPLNEKVIFPNAKAESMGMEDVRFVKFEDGDTFMLLWLIYGLQWAPY